MTKNELIAQFKTENPKVISILNGEQVELTAEEYEANALAWAEMKLEQNKAAEDQEAKANAKQALLDRLGISAEEAVLLLT